MTLHLSLAQLEAGRAYGRAWVASKREDRAMARVHGGQALRKAAGALLAPEVAILDLVEGRGLTLRDVRDRTGRDLADLEAIYGGALAKLVFHFESEGSVR